jgi:hypothetical protein
VATCPFRVDVGGAAAMLQPQRGQNLARGGFVRPQAGQITDFCLKDGSCDDCISDSFPPDYQAWDNQYLSVVCNVRYQQLTIPSTEP